jgi:FkbM family methyltransferase
VEFTEEVFKKRIAALLPAKAAAARGNSADANQVNHKAPIDLSGLWTIPDDEQFLQEAYRRILGRECDISGFINYVEILRRHVPRRVVVMQLINSEEGRRRGVRFTGIPEASAGAGKQRLIPSVRQIVAGLAAQVRELLRGPLYARFDTIDHKLDFVLREVAVRSDGLSARTDEVLWTVSKKLDSYVADVEAQELQTRDALQAEIAAQAKASEAVAEEVDRLRSTVLEMEQEIARLRAETAELQARRYPVTLSSAGVVSTEVDGFIVGLPASEWRLAAYHAFRGVPEPGVVRRFQSLIKPGMIVADVGANIGIYTLYAARALSGHGRVYAFEPAPRTMALLQDNVQVNGFRESGIVELEQVAISDRAGTSRLAVFAEDSGHNTLFWDDTAASIEVPTVTLDEVLAGEPRVDVVKIDAEGAEPFVLRGMRGIIERSPDIHIILEFAPEHLLRAGIQPLAFLDEIAALGFAAHRIHDETGELLELRRDELASVFSANLELSRR